MTAQKIKISSQTSFFVIILSLFIIGESIWLVSRLNKFSRPGGKTEIKPEIKQQSTSQPKALIIISGKNNLRVGDVSEAELFLQAKENITLEGADFVLSFDPLFLTVIDSDPTQAGIQVSPETGIFKTVGRNFVEQEKKKILLTFIALKSEDTVTFKAGEKVKMATIRVKAEKAGQTVLKAETTYNDPKSSILIGSADKKAIPLAAEGWDVIISN